MLLIPTRKPPSLETACPNLQTAYLGQHLTIRMNLDAPTLRCLLRCRFNISTIVLFALISAMAGVAQQKNADETGLRDTLAQNEQALIQAEKQHDAATFHKLLRDDLIYVAFNGWVFTKKELIAKMHYIDVQRYTPENIKLRLPSPNIALITYDLTAKANIAGHNLPHKQYVSSLWVKNSGEWQLLFHQATPATHP